MEGGSARCRVWGWRRKNNLSRANRGASAVRTHGSTAPRAPSSSPQSSPPPLPVLAVVRRSRRRRCRPGVSRPTRRSRDRGRGAPLSAAPRTPARSRRSPTWRTHPPSPSLARADRRGPLPARGACLDHATPGQRRAGTVRRDALRAARPARPREAQAPADPRRQSRTPGSRHRRPLQPGLSAAARRVAPAIAHRLARHRGLA